MGKKMVKEHLFFMMGKSMLGNGRMEKRMVKVHTLGLLETNLPENIRIIRAKHHLPFWRLEIVMEKSCFTILTLNMRVRKNVQFFTIKCTKLQNHVLR